LAFIWSLSFFDLADVDLGAGLGVGPNVVLEVNPLRDEQGGLRGARPRTIGATLHMERRQGGACVLGTEGEPVSGGAHSMKQRSAQFLSRNVRL